MITRLHPEVEITLTLIVTRLELRHWELGENMAQSRKPLVRSK
jgi:hypothetical protein